jgi:hypothetical protein
VKTILSVLILIAIIVLRETLSEISREIGKDLYETLKGLIREMIERHKGVAIEIKVPDR